MTIKFIDYKIVLYFNRTVIGRGVSMSNLGNKKTMAKNIKRLMSENNMNSKDVYTRIGVPPTTFSNWVNAETYPRIDKIELMAKLFGVSKAELVEENYISLAGLNLDQIKEVKRFIEFLKNS